MTEADKAALDYLFDMTDGIRTQAYLEHCGTYTVWYSKQRASSRQMDTHVYHGATPAEAIAKLMAAVNATAPKEAQS